MSEKVVWQLLRPYAAAAGVAGIAPHDLGRTTAKLCRAAGEELEQIQLLLGHASVQTTERYLGTKQDLVPTRPIDGIKLRVAVSAYANRLFVCCQLLLWLDLHFAQLEVSGNQFNESASEPGRVSGRLGSGCCVRIAN